MSDEEGENGPADLIHRVSEQTTYLLDLLKHKVDADGDVNSKAEVEKHLCNSYEWAFPDYELEDKVSSQLRGIMNPLTAAFDASCEPISTQVIPNLTKESKTKIVILEFFTQCCINCIHSIEELRAALQGVKEQRESAVPGKCEIKLISVHSPKFTREKNQKAVRDFVERMKMYHADVVNDPEMTLWSALGISCWPTILIFGPNPNPVKSNAPYQMNLIYAIKGEGHGAELTALLLRSLDYFNKQFQFYAVDQIVSQPNYVQLTEETEMSNSILKYPGKIEFYDNMLAVADSGNNRILILNPQGAVQEIIGGTGRGLKDGDFRTARFYNPQGIVFQSPRVLFVADTGNHSVRRIDLQAKKVITWILPNKTAELAHDGNPPPQLKSPWDLAFYGPGVLLVAAAGSHQIFGYFFEDIKLFGRDHAKSSFDLIAGTGKEENRNNNYILKSAFAQPSGICVNQWTGEGDKIIYIADSESSSIRNINVNGKVMGLVGGNRDPCDLFTYGDQDGCGYDVRLQHPVGVCASHEPTKIFIADTYNHKIKVIEVGSKRCTTLIGDGAAGNRVGGFADHDAEEESIASLNEPGGISHDGRNQLLYIADTNNHCIKVANLTKLSVSVLEIQLDTVDSHSQSGSGAASNQSPPLEDDIFTCEVPCSKSGFSLILNIPNMGPKLEGVKWKVESSTNLTFLVDRNELPPEALWQLDGIVVTGITYVDPDLPAEFSIRADFYFCGSNVCSAETKRFKFVFPTPAEDFESPYHVYFEYSYPGSESYDFITDFQAASAS